MTPRQPPADATLDLRWVMQDPYCVAMAQAIMLQPYPAPTRPGADIGRSLAEFMVQGGSDAFLWVREYSLLRAYLHAALHEATYPHLFAHMSSETAEGLDIDELPASEGHLDMCVAMALPRITNVPSALTLKFGCFTGKFTPTSVYIDCRGRSVCFEVHRYATSDGAIHECSGRQDYFEVQQATLFFLTRIG